MKKGRLLSLAIQQLTLQAPASISTPVHTILRHKASECRRPLIDVFNRGRIPHCLLIHELNPLSERAHRISSKVIPGLFNRRESVRVEIAIIHLLKQV